MANTVNLDTVELVSVQRVAPQFGAVSSSDFNAYNLEVLTDLASLADKLNSQILPLVNALLAGALLPSESPVGIEGRTMIADSSDSSSLFFDSLNNVPLSLADSLRRLNNMLASFQQQVTDMSISVGALQSQLSSDNRNDIAIALQNLVNTIATLTAAQNSLALEVTGIQASLSKTKTGRFALSSVASGTSTANISWPVAFLDNNYSVTLSIQDSTGAVSIKDFSYQAMGVGITVTLNNSSGSPVTTALLHAIAIHD